MLLVAVKIKHATCFFFLIDVSLHYPQPPEFSGMSDVEYTEEGKCLHHSVMISTMIPAHDGKNHEQIYQVR